MTNSTQKGKVTSRGHHLVLEDISCVDAEGKVFEKYKRLYVAKDVAVDSKSKVLEKNLYQWITYFEEKGLVLPSFALSCNVLVALCQNRSEPEVEKVLRQYENPRPNLDSYGLHSQNTIVDGKNGTIIHYPSKEDFPDEHSGNEQVNQNRERTELTFTPGESSDIFLEEALKDPHYNRYLQNLTGLRDPSDLIEVGYYFNRRSCVEANEAYKTGARLGCNLFELFVLDASYDPGIESAARGVRMPGNKN